MSCCVTKNYYSPQKKRILLLNTAEIRRKTQVRQPYCNLYAYGANNPVRYIDPDGRAVPIAATLFLVGPFTVATIEAYLQMPLGKQGSQALADAISYGAQSANQAVSNAITAIKTAVKEKQETKLYMTYTMTDADGLVYSGRTSGYGTPSEVLENRQNNHHTAKQGFGNVQIDKIAYGGQDKLAIRGREQQLIDKNGTTQSDTINGHKGTSGNAIRGVSKFNPRVPIYHKAANKAFGILPLIQDLEQFRSKNGKKKKNR